MASVDDVKRLGRAVVFVHQHDYKIVDRQVRAEVEALLLTGNAMDFAARLKGHRDTVVLTREIVEKYAVFAGLGVRELTAVLPALKHADILDYTMDSEGKVSHIEEYVGVSASVVEQTVKLLNELGPQRSDLAFLHSVEVGAIAPLSTTNHLEQIIARGFTDYEAKRALVLAKAVGIIQSAPSKELNKDVEGYSRSS